MLSYILSASISGTDPRIHFNRCEERSCVRISRTSFPAFLERTPDLDSRITLCSERAKLFNGKTVTNVNQTIIPKQCCICH